MDKATRDELRTRNNALQEQVESMMATVQRQQHQLATAQGQLASVVGRGESADGLVRATANAAGTITNVELAADAFGKSTPEKLGRSITEAVQKAAAGAQEATAALFAPVIAANDELPDLADLVPGAPSIKDLLPSAVAAPVAMAEPVGVEDDDDGPWQQPILKDTW